MIKEEKGAALVVVLLMMTIFTILGLGLLAQNIHSAKQFNKTGDRLKATHLAEMGVVYTETKFKQQIDQIVEEWEEEQELQEESMPLLPIHMADKLEEYSARFIDVKNINGEDRFIIDNMDVELDTEEVLISFNSIGTTANDESREISSTMRISPSMYTIPGEEDQEPTNPGSYFNPPKSALYTTDPFNTGNTDIDYRSRNDHVVFNDGVTLHQNNNLRAKHLWVKGTAYVPANSNIIVYGNFVSYGTVGYQTNKNETGNMGLVCVEGSLYTDKFDDLKDIVKPLPLGTTCESMADEKHESGIFARALKPLEQAPQYDLPEKETPKEMIIYEWGQGRVSTSVTY